MLGVACHNGDGLRHRSFLEEAQTPRPSLNARQCEVGARRSRSVQSSSRGIDSERGSGPRTSIADTFVFTAKPGMEGLAILGITVHLYQTFVPAVEEAGGNAISRSSNHSRMSFSERGDSEPLSSSPVVT